MSNPFRYFNSSPEVIRLVVMMYVRYPLSLSNVEDLPGRAQDRHQPRDRPVLVEPVWSNVRRRDPQETRRAHARPHPVALAFGIWMRRDLRPLIADARRQRGGRACDYGRPPNNQVADPDPLSHSYRSRGGEVLRPVDAVAAILARGDGGLFTEDILDRAHLALSAPATTVTDMVTATSPSAARPGSTSSISLLDRFQAGKRFGGIVTSRT